MKNEYKIVICDRIVEKMTENHEKFDDDGLLFSNETGYSMHFILLMNDSTERDKLKKKIESRLGCVHTSTEDIGPHSLVLTDLDNMKWRHDKIERFKIGYISACFDRKKIMDLNKFLWETSSIYKKHFEYLKVVFDRSYTWDTIPQEFIINQSNSQIESESDTDSDDSFTNTAYLDATKSDASKHTRDPYSRIEKETIVKYIVEKKTYDRLRGREVWQELERLNLCPKRTWQSMKEHTLKKIAKEVNSFTFLTPKQREKLRNSLTKPKDK